MSSRRLPLSCENCRQRKIRCINSGYNAPCDTCSRRGYASRCRFRRQDPYETAARSPDATNVSSLEELLRQNIAVTTALLGQQNEARLPSPNSSPPVSQNAIEDRPANPIPQQPGRLVVSPSNHVRFIPSNGLGDSDLIDAMQGTTSGCPTGFPFFEQAGANAVSDELLDMLPPLPQLEELKAVYFNVFSPIFHILHDPTFHGRYDEFMQNPKRISLPFLALLFVILSLSVTALDESNPLLMHLGRDPSPGANIRSLSAKYRGAAMRCLVADNFMFRHSLSTVQCLVLLIYAINHAQGPAWSLLGTTLHIAVAVGCAVDPEWLNVNRIEAEERRRCWAALQMLYTIQNTCLGNLMPFRIDSDVELPADIEDDDLTLDKCNHLPGKDDAPTKMTYLLYKFRLYNLAFEICQLTCTDNHAKADALDVKISYEQQHHFTRFASRPLAELEPYHQAHYYILTIYTNHLTVLLHRPWLSDNRYKQSSCRCERAVTTILSNFEKLSSDPIFRSYRWYVDGLGSFYAFFSITTLLVLHGNGQLDGQSRPETMRLLLRCVELLVSNASRSAVCSKAAAILEPAVQHLNPVVLTTTHYMSPIGEDAMYTVFPELGNLFFDVPCEQLLAPAGFPWVTPSGAV